jgi:hypothetical protein
MLILYACYDMRFVEAQVEQVDTAVAMVYGEIFSYSPMLRLPYYVNADVIHLMV